MQCQLKVSLTGLQGQQLIKVAGIFACFDPVVQMSRAQQTGTLPVAAVGPSKSSLALRIRTSSTESWLIFARRNRISALPLLASPSRVPPESLPLFAWKGAR